MAHWLYNKRKFTSKITGAECWDMTFVDINTGQEYHCYVDRSNKNYQRWIPVITAGRPALVFKGLRFKKNRPDIINADSDFDYTDFNSYQDLARNLETYWSLSA